MRREKRKVFEEGSLPKRRVEKTIPKGEEQTGRRVQLRKIREKYQKKK